MHTYIHTITYIQLHTYIHALHYITLHYITLPYLTLHYITYIHTLHIHIDTYIYVCIYRYIHMCMYIYILYIYICRGVIHRHKPRHAHLKLREHAVALCGPRRRTSQGPGRNPRWDRRRRPVADPYDRSNAQCNPRMMVVFSGITVI